MTRRIRQVRREFWSDSEAGSWPDDVRLFYIGLWCLADDDGWLEADVPSMAHELYGYQSTRAGREAKVARMLDTLMLAGKVVLDDCGRHARIPTLTDWQYIAGRKNFEVRDAHRRACMAMADHGRPGPAVAVGEGKGSEGREVSVHRAQARDDTPPRGLTASAQAILDDPTSTDEAKAGATLLLQWSRPTKAAS